MPRSVWQDLAAIQGRMPRVCLPSDNGPGREIVYPGALYPNSAEHVSYDELTIPLEVNPNPNQSIHLLIMRANQRAPLLTDDYLRCMTYLIQRLMDKGSSRIHLPILDPERPNFSLVNLYHALANMFEGTGIHVVLHSRVYVSILSIGLEQPCHLNPTLFPLYHCLIVISPGES